VCFEGTFFIVAIIIIHSNHVILILDPGSANICHI
jgi:hypothetical protein